MTLKRIPAAPEARPCANISADLLPLALDRWNPDVQAAAEDDNAISIFDPIGYDWWTGEGVTAKRINGILRGMAGEDVVVNINSPGGDMFEGLAIYNLLREYQGKVTVKVLGLAASAASIVAMAGDEVQIARSGFFMIHNCWVVASGNRNDLHEMAEKLSPFDSAMADIYAARTGDSLEAMQALMDEESWIGGSAAIESGFADALLPSDATRESAQARAPAQVAARRLDVILAKSGMPRSERRQLLQEIKTSTLCAAGPGTPSAAAIQAQQAAALAELERAMQQFKAAASRTGD